MRRDDDVEEFGDVIGETLDGFVEFVSDWFVLKSFFHADVVRQV